MRKCWDPDPSRRPAAEKVFDEVLGFLVTYTMGKKHNRYRDDTYKSFEEGEKMLTTRTLDRSQPRLVLNQLLLLKRMRQGSIVIVKGSILQPLCKITRQFIEFRTTISSKYHDQLAASEKLIQNLREELDKVSAIHKQIDTDISVVVETAEIHIDAINSSITSIQNNANNHTHGKLEW